MALSGSLGTGRGKGVTFLCLCQCLLQPPLAALGLGSLALRLAQQAAQAHRSEVPVILGRRTQIRGSLLDEWGPRCPAGGLGGSGVLTCTPVGTTAAPGARGSAARWEGGREEALRCLGAAESGETAVFIALYHTHQGAV